ncbi:MAG: hypothetical protein EKK53_20905 [Burkholderiales bacterium]|nr:MAG: hypothetical protein EKK53_20905 [Burkholderiales bacterium]
MQQRSHIAQFNAFVAKLAPSPAMLSGAGRKIDCGWYDSSFELARGLEVVEQDDDSLYQLWELARH